jgi:hypothetical protein
MRFVLLLSLFVAGSDLVAGGPPRSPASIVRLVPTDPCTLVVPLYAVPANFTTSKICASEDEGTYEVKAHWLVRGYLYTDGAIIYGPFGSFDQGTHLGMGTGPGGVSVVGQLLVKPTEANLFYANAVISPDATVIADGDGETDSVGVATIGLNTIDRHGFFPTFANTDPTLGGGYLVHLTATSLEAVYWDRTRSTPNQFVVRSVSGRRATFTFLVTSPQVHNGNHPNRLLAEPNGELSQTRATSRSPR